MPFIAAHMLAAALVALAASPSVAQTAIKFSLDGPAEGPEALFLLPQDKGYFKAEGLDVVIDEAASPLDPINRVASGTYELGFADFNRLIRYRDQHPSAAVRPIFVVYDKPSYSIVARRSRGIVLPKDLENKKLGAPTAGSTYAEWPLFAKLNDINPAKVTIENIAIPVRAPMLAAGQIDGALGASFFLYVDLKDRGVPVDDIVLMPMANYGLRLYGSVILVNSKFSAEKPEAVRSFLNAFVKGVKDAHRRPDEVVQVILKRDDAARKEVELQRLTMAMRDNIVTPEVIANGIGGVDPARLQQAIDQIGLVYNFKSKPTAATAFDYSFLPPLAERRIN